MTQRVELKLNETERIQLVQLRDHAVKPYLRERSAALLKIADGQSQNQVALYGLLKRREPETIGEWIKRFREEGIDGLVIRPGRGRKPAFSPSEPGGSASAG